MTEEGQPRIGNEGAPQLHPERQVLVDLVGDFKRGSQHLLPDSQHVISYLIPQGLEQIRDNVPQELQGAYDDIHIEASTVAFAQIIAEEIRNYATNPNSDGNTVRIIRERAQKLIQERENDHPKDLKGRVEQYASNADKTDILLELGLTLLEQDSPSIKPLREAIKNQLARTLGKPETSMQDAIGILKTAREDAKYDITTIAKAQEAQDRYDRYIDAQKELIRGVLPNLARASDTLQDIPRLTDAEREDVKLSPQTLAVLNYAIEIVNSQDPADIELFEDTLHARIDTKGDPLKRYKDLAFSADQIIKLARKLVEEDAEEEERTIDPNLPYKFNIALVRVALRANPEIEWASEMIEAGYEAAERDLKLKPETEIAAALSIRISQAIEFDASTTRALHELGGIRRGDRNDLHIKDASKYIAKEAGILLRELFRGKDETTARAMLDQLTNAPHSLTDKQYGEKARDYMTRANSIIELLTFTKALIESDESPLSTDEKQWLMESVVQQAAKPHGLRKWRERLIAYPNGAKKDVLYSLALNSLNAAIADAEYRPESIQALDRATRRSSLIS